MKPRSQSAAMEGAGWYNRHSSMQAAGNDKALVFWRDALFLAAGAITGGIAGTHAARRIGRTAVRRIVVAVGLAMAFSRNTSTARAISPISSRAPPWRTVWP